MYQAYYLNHCLTVDVDQLCKRCLSAIYSYIRQWLSDLL